MVDARPPGPTGRRPSLIALVVFLVIVVLTAALSWFARRQNDMNENRLLRLQTRQTGTLLQSYLETLQTPLASAAQIAASSGGASSSYRSYASSFLRKQVNFTSVSLWRVDDGAEPTLVATTGATPELEASASRRDAFLTQVARSGQVGVIGFLGGATRHLGYGFASATDGHAYVVYAEDVLKPAYRSTTATTSPFADLRYALYLGRSRTSATLLATSERHLPLGGRTAVVVVPFGTGSLTLVAAPLGALDGPFANSRWWIIAIFGALVALGAGLALDRLVKRRTAAEALAGEIEELLRAQRTIAETLQRAMMPSAVPRIAGLELAVRYFPGVNGIEIGGDWYDVVAIDDEHFFFVVGDVSGRGLEAGSIMASLHFAIRAFVREGHGPATVLTLLTRLLDISHDKHFATVVCGVGDLTTRQVSIANAGHLPPLVVADGHSEFVSTDVGPPIGVRRSFDYRTVTVAMTPGSTLLVYTDGLVERRGETIDAGLRRLQDCARDASTGLDALVTTITAELTPHGADDDTAVLGFRWTDLPEEPA